MQLDELFNEQIDETVKGMPATASGITVAGVGRAGWNVLDKDFATPFATLTWNQVNHNSKWMRQFGDRFGLRLCPHGKTTMAPQLFKLQMDDGAIGITVATIQQMRVCRKYGITWILMANQLVGEGDARYVLNELRAHPDLRFLCIVDSEDNVRMLSDVARTMAIGRPLEVLLELGVAGGRSGCRTIAEAVALAEIVANNEQVLRLAGTEGFEGVIVREEADEMESAVNSYLEELCILQDELLESGSISDSAAAPILSVGGSLHIDLIAMHPHVQRLTGNCEIIVRAGCYLTHDSHMMVENYSRIRQRTPSLEQFGAPPAPALKVWGRIQSLPEAGLAIVNVGKRDISYDVALPVPEAWFCAGRNARGSDIRGKVRAIDINDQHLFMHIPTDSKMAVGDLVSFGVSHPCTTFDKWQLIYAVNDNYDVIDAIRTYF